MPRVAEADRIGVTRLDGGFYVLLARYGFTETPDVPRLLANARGCGAPFDVMQTSFFLSRETLIAAPGHDLNAVEERVFIALSHIAQDATEFFRIPPGRVVELGAQVTV